jgi:hypothetical protein
MSRAKAKLPRTDATRKIKDKRVLKSSHGKFATVFDLEEHRVTETARNKKSRKGKKDED